MKSEPYQSLLVIHQATQQIVEHVGLLQTEGLLTPHFAEIRRLAAEQNCAETSTSVLLSLADRERDDATQFEQERLQREKELSSC
jgi:hypothetical protein